MPYEPTIWKNREVERPRTYTKVENPDGTITLIPQEGNIIEPGTPIIAENMNKIEQGIKEAHELIEDTVSKEEFNEHKANFEELDTRVGPLSSLITTIKTSIVGAINSLKEEVNEHKAQTASISAIGHVYAAEFTATLSTSWSGSTAPYTQTVTINGITSAHNPIIDVVMSGTYSTDQQRIEQWGHIYRAVTGTNQITFYALEKPTVSLPIRVKVVR